MVVYFNSFQGKPDDVQEAICKLVLVTGAQWGHAHTVGPVLCQCNLLAADAMPC